MDNVLIVAIVGAGASMLVAVTGFVSAWITSRRTIENAKSIELLKQSSAASIELLKQSFAQTQKSSDFADAALASTLDALKQGMSGIQAVKDEIRLIQSSIGDGLTSQEALSRITKARDRMLATYTDCLSNLHHPDEASALHEAKNITLELCAFLQEELRDKHFASALPEAPRAQLMEVRTRLTDHQNVLRDFRTEYIAQRTLKQM